MTDESSKSADQLWREEQLRSGEAAMRSMLSDQEGQVAEFIAPKEESLSDRVGNGSALGILEEMYSRPTLVSGNPSVSTDLETAPIPTVTAPVPTPHDPIGFPPSGR